MGNETSSVKIHSLLTADDLKRLRAGFPDGGAGAKPPSKLDWGAWNEFWSPGMMLKLSTALSSNNEITFQSYQRMAGDVVRGTTEERIKLLFCLILPQSTSEAKRYEKKIKLGGLTDLVQEIVTTATKMVVFGATLDKDSVSSSILAKSLVHELSFPGKSSKECLNVEVTEDSDLDFDCVERWAVMKCPLFDRIFRFVLASSFCMEVIDDIIPSQGHLRLDSGRNTALSPADVFFLNSVIPRGNRWRPLFDSSSDGESFAKLLGALTSKAGRTPTIVLVWEAEGGHVLGAYASQPWRTGPKFFGDDSSFLFTLSPRHFRYESTTFNSNYQYLNANAKTLPNGLGMGGQLDYFGLWLEAEFGRAKCAPTCSSFSSPQLSSKESFRYTRLEVWGVGDEPKDGDEDEELEEGGSILDKNQQTVAVMEMMGKTFISKDVKAADENSEKN